MNSQAQGESSGRRRATPGYALVLGTIVLSIVVIGSAGDTDLGRFLALVILAAALLIALRAAQVRPRTMRIAAAIIVVAIGAELMARLSGGVPRAFTQALTLVLIGATPVVLARRLVQNPEVTAQSLIGALCVYLLLGLFFAFVFGLTGAVSGTAFFVSPDNATSADFLYFSYVTLATVGYGDLVARTNLGRMFAVTEALTGQLYLVIVVALLVSNFRPRRPRGEE